jgi:NADH-quinone oxidoreductase subunit H
MDQIFVNLKSAILTIAGGFLPSWAVTLVCIAVSIGAIAALGPLTMMYLTLIERKVLARMQNRVGPNRVGPWGLLQPVADGVKMFTKEDIIPKNADAIVHLIAPCLIIIPAFLIFAVIPYGKNMIPVDLSVGVLYFIAISSTTTIAIFSAAWSSRNKYSMLGGMRAVAQMISYEIPMVLSIVPVLLISQSLSTGAIVNAQGSFGGWGWFVFTPWGFAAFLIFFLCAVAECNRSPFDLPEAESEIVAGFHTEYSGMKFALFYMAEFMNAFTLSALAATLFLGGWQGPFLPSWAWFFLKTYALIFIMLWFRGTLPRFRVDHMMNLAWKFLLPLSLINILVAGFWHFANPPLAIGGSIAILWAAGWLFTVLNRAYMPENRTYRFGE